MRLLDTDVCIDLLRKHPPALAWFAGLTERPGIPGFVAIELIIGCRDKAELRRVRRFLKDFALAWPTEADMLRALTEYAPLHLAYGVGGIDAVIAATASGGNHLLATFNVKHFGILPDVTTEQPYTR